MTHSIRLAGVVVLLLASTACLQPSVFPLVTPGNSTFDPALIGEWRCTGEVWTIAEQQEDDRRGYSVRIVDSGQTVELRAWLGRIGEQTFVDFMPGDDLVPDDSFEFENRFAGWHVMPAHTFGRLSIEADVLRLRMLSMEWTENYAASQGESFGLLTRYDVFVLAAPTSELRQLASRFGDDDEAFPVQAELVRAPADPARGRCYSDGH